jgi:hypothetical protein
LLDAPRNGDNSRVVRRLVVVNGLPGSGNTTRPPILAGATRLDQSWKDWALDPHPLGVGALRRVRTDRPISDEDRDAIVAFLTRGDQCAPS